MNEEMTIESIFMLAAKRSLKPRAWTWKPLQTYNGFTHDQRVLKWQAIYLGIQLGLITPAEDYNCDICGTSPNHATISFHSEDYSSMTGHFPLCQSCHTRIHRRFTNPIPWGEILDKYGDGSKWFERLK
ncbi:hypothetical protein KI809_07820 [Geobacter pelophilus]|uniref:HNH endonuclease n=1 Tax=Geoanaerobacter pelophilus TaxID=60036 RepID=A0AAW4L5C8_9BACT|nr:hypothetical protein [Geoanaerobacter pelophilus]MBT0664208.1 hypothetical protein [Geoanaerobacter pelophilus]